MQNNAPIVKFENVCLSYPGVPTVFSDVSFRLTPGSFTFLTGASGSGKTSLMKLIYLALRATNGSVSLLAMMLIATSRTFSTYPPPYWHCFARFWFG